MLQMGDSIWTRTKTAIDSTVPIANGLIKATKADIVNYDPENHDAFATLAMDYDGVIVRIAPV